MNNIDFHKFVEQQDAAQAGYARIERLLRGEIPAVRSLGFLPSAALDDLQDRSYRPLRIKEGLNESLIVPNISRQETIDIGAKYGQPLVIWAKKHFDEANHPYFRFEQTDGEQVFNVRVSTSEEDPSELRIPLFDNRLAEVLDGEPVSYYKEELSYDFDVQDAAMTIKECEDELMNEDYKDNPNEDFKLLRRELIHNCMKVIGERNVQDG